MTFTLRPYQTEAVQKLRDSLRSNKRIMLYSPTGSGKTEMGMTIIRGAHAKNKKVGFICNRIGLIDQASRRFNRAGIPHGIVQADNTHHVNSNVLICSIQTLARRGYPPFDLMIIDEAHGATSEAYLNLLKSYSNVPTIGLSATPFTKGLGKEYDWGKPFEEMVCAITIRELIDQGFLVDCDIYAPSEPDLRKVRTIRGDYDEKQIAKIVDQPALIGDVVGQWKKYANGLPTVAFCVNIAHSKHTAEKFLEQGISAEHIDCYMPQEEIDAVLRRLHDGTTTIVCNVDKLCEGWDEPMMACAIIDRPTKSLKKWIQMIGRTLRPFSDKEKAIIIDHAGNCHRLGFPTDDLPLELNDGNKPEPSSDSMPVERKPHKCPNCFYMIPVGLTCCPKCGTVPQRQDKTKHEEGELKKVDRKPIYSAEQKQQLWSESLGLMEQRKKSNGWAAHLYKSLTGSWPNGLADVSCVPSKQVIDMAMHNAIRYAKRQGEQNERRGNAIIL